MKYFPKSVAQCIWRASFVQFKSSVKLFCIFCIVGLMTNKIIMLCVIKYNCTEKRQTKSCKRALFNWADIKL